MDAPDPDKRFRKNRCRALPIMHPKILFRGGLVDVVCHNGPRLAGTGICRLTIHDPSRDSPGRLRGDVPVGVDGRASTAIEGAPFEAYDAQAAP